MYEIQTCYQHTSCHSEGPKFPVYKDIPVRPQGLFYSSEHVLIALRPKPATQSHKDNFGLRLKESVLNKKRQKNTIKLHFGSGYLNHHVQVDIT